MMDATSRLIADIENANRADRRRWLYANDPIWRLTKLKANWEDREARRRAGLKSRRVDGRREWRA